MGRLFLRDILPMPRVFLHGPRWRRLFDVRELLIDDEFGVRRVWVYDLEADVRERVCEEVRPDVFAEWSDPRERLA
jgi:hypothetical protein